MRRFALLGSRKQCCAGKWSTSPQLVAAMKTLRHRRKWVRLLEAIYKGKVLNKEATAALIKQLSTLKQSYIPRLLPDNVQVANKPGELEAVRTDSGIVFAPNRPFAISVMTAYDRDATAAVNAISEVGLEGYHYFEMRGKTSEYGRILPTR